jgi:two-component system chemotaxis response regulator CheB
MLSRSPFIEVVGAARNGEEALELVTELKPDVVTCDLNMPDMDGVSFIREQMGRRRLPILVMSVANAAGEQVLAALEAGAVDFVHKPTALASEQLMDVTDELIQKVKLAATATFRPTETPVGVDAPPPLVSAFRGMESIDIVVVGISTGGPQGLKLVIPRLPADLPVPVAIVLHMPVGYTELYARKLDELCALEVVEANEGDAIVAGRVFLAPAGRHLSFRRSGGAVTAHLDVRPLDTPHRPSVDVLFHSAAEVFGERTLGVVMTGMGADGRTGSAWIKAKGGRVLTEAESSCVVYGMPRSVVEAGLSDASVDIERMADAIMERI